ncbi:MAG: hypothetical protein A4E74_02181 [Syntrophus sp. PtaB.Bin075]|nr:MAG: hypothetical protein A4E74_02181 [Syntrophus sp. PtaB.Bin075]
MECPLFEPLDRSIAASCPFGKSHDGMSLSNDTRRFFHAFQGTVMIAPVNRNVTRIPHGGAEEGDPEEFLFGNPAERNRQAGQSDQGVHVTLVIGCKDLRAVHKNVVAAGYLDGNMGKRKQNSRPEPGEFVNAVFSRAEEGEDHSPEAQDRRDGHPHKNQQNRTDHDPFPCLSIRMNPSEYP